MKNVSEIDSVFCNNLTRGFVKSYSFVFQVKEEVIFEITNLAVEGTASLDHEIGVLRLEGNSLIKCFRHVFPHYEIPKLLCLCFNQGRGDCFVNLFLDVAFE